MGAFPRAHPARVAIVCDRQMTTYLSRPGNSPRHVDRVVAATTLGWRRGRICLLRWSAAFVREGVVVNPENAKGSVRYRLMFLRSE